MSQKNRIKSIERMFKEEEDIIGLFYRILEKNQNPKILRKTLKTMSSWAEFKLQLLSNPKIMSLVLSKL